jgi:hypothetical protein
MIHMHKTPQSIARIARIPIYTPIHRHSLRSIPYSTIARGDGIIDRSL